MDAMVLNPPSGWSGLPKLPDLVRQISLNRESAAEQAKASNVERAPDPSCERCRGTGWRPELGSTRVVKCHCWAPRPKLESKPALPPAEEDRKTLRDVLKSVVEKVSGATIDKAAKPMPEAPVSSILISPEAQEKRRQQMLRDLEAKGPVQ